MEQPTEDVTNMCEWLLESVLTSLLDQQILWFFYVPASYQVVNKPFNHWLYPLNYTIIIYNNQL